MQFLQTIIKVLHDTLCLTINHMALAQYSIIQNLETLLPLLDIGMIQSLYFVTFKLFPQELFSDYWQSMNSKFLLCQFSAFFSYTRRLGDLDMERVTFLLFIVLLATEFWVGEVCEDLSSVAWQTRSCGVTSGCCHVTSVCNEQGDYICIKHH